MLIEVLDSEMYHKMSNGHHVNIYAHIKNKIKLRPQIIKQLYITTSRNTLKATIFKTNMCNGWIIIWTENQKHWSHKLYFLDIILSRIITD